MAIPPIARVRDVAATLRACGHSTFPVTPDVAGARSQGEAFELHGVVSRATLVRLLQARLGLFGRARGEAAPPAAERVPGTQAGRLALLDALQQRPLKQRRQDEAAVLDGLTEVRGRGERGVGKEIC